MPTNFTWPRDLLDPEIDPDEYYEYNEEDTAEKEITIPSMPWRDAVKANKTRDTCILCGAKTRKVDLLNSSIKACSCVDALAKKEFNR